MTNTQGLSLHSTQRPEWLPEDIRIQQQFHTLPALNTRWHRTNGNMEVGLVAYPR